MELVWKSVQKTAYGGRCAERVAAIDRQLVQVAHKKERLLELSIEGLLTNEDFKEQNDRLNEQRRILYRQQKENTAQQKQEQIGKETVMQVIEEELGGILHQEVAASILQKAVVCADSTKEKIHLYVQFGLEQMASVYFLRKPFTFCRGSC